MKNFLTISIILISMSLSAQAVLTVDNNQGAAAQYSDLQTAINAANVGDTIYVQPSPNGYGNIIITKTLSIYGIGHIPELNAGLSASINIINFNNDAPNTKLSGLQISKIQFNNSGGNNHDVVITNNRIGSIDGNNTTSAANNMVISGNYFKGFYNIDNKNSQNWIITNNLFEQTSINPMHNPFGKFNATTTFSNNIILTRQNGDANQSIELFNNCDGTQISNNIFLFTGANVSNFNLGTNTALSFSNNLTFNYNSILDALPGTNNLDNTDPLFTNFNENTNLNTTTNDFQLQAGSPAVNAGTDGNDLGVFNGGFPFNLRGYPTELPYLTEFTIFNTSVDPGGTLNINFKANANINN